MTTAWQGEKVLIGSSTSNISDSITRAFAGTAEIQYYSLNCYFINNDIVYKNVAGLTGSISTIVDIEVVITIKMKSLYWWKSFTYYEYDGYGLYTRGLYESNTVGYTVLAGGFPSSYGNLYDLSFDYDTTNLTVSNGSKTFKTTTTGESARTVHLFNRFKFDYGRTVGFTAKLDVDYKGLLFSSKIDTLTGEIWFKHNGSTVVAASKP